MNDANLNDNDDQDDEIQYNIEDAGKSKTDHDKISEIVVGLLLKNVLIKNKKKFMNSSKIKCFAF